MSNLWTKVAITTTHENIEPLCGALLAIGLEAVEIDDPAENLRFLESDEAASWDYLDESLPTKGEPIVRFYLSPDENRWSDEAITQAVGSLGTVVFERVKDDWTDAWLEFYKPLKIGERIVVRPFWEEYAPAEGEIVFSIDPGHVFGTGQHQSTELCIKLLDKYVKVGMRVLDIGCGSGILGIIALQLGASRLTAIDIDPAAAKMVAVNAGLNNIDESRYNAFCTNILEEKVQDTFELVLANIVADVIIPLSPIVAGLIAPEGLFISSGIIDDRQDEVKAALQAQGFEILEILTKDNWVAIAARHRNHA